MAKTRTLEPEEWALWHTWMRAHRLLARELDRDLQREHAISKAEFSVLVTLRQTPAGPMRVSALVDALGWEKSRVSHQLTRMENRGLVQRADGEPGGRRVSIALTDTGRRTVDSAIVSHGANIRRHFFDPATAEQAAAIRAWSEATVAHLD